MHAAFIGAFEDLRREYDSDGGKLTMLLKINKTVAAWLREHIMVHDKEFAAYYRDLEA